MYTFRHIKPDTFRQYLANTGGEHAGMEVLCRICGEDVICSEEQCAEYLGRLWALFGAPDDPEEYEDFYSYTILAEQEDTAQYFHVVQYCGLPTIYGAPEGAEAAGELAALIRRTPPADYEWKGAYAEYDVEMTYRVCGGIASAEDQPLGFWDEETEILNHIIDRVFEVMSDDEANDWLKRCTTPEAMREYWDSHPELH